MSQHLMPSVEESLLKTAEEAGEIVQAVTKLLQHGPFSYNPVKPEQGNNRDHLAKELGDMLGLIKWCFEQGYVDGYILQEAARTKMHRVAEYAHAIIVPPGYVPHDLQPMERFWTSNGFRFSVSDIDVPRVKDKRWYAVAKDPERPYVRSDFIVDGKHVCLYLHKIIVGCPPHLKVDHRNNDTLCNERPNLRVATGPQNNANRRPFARSGYKGVYAEGRLFRARITHNEKTRGLGYHPTREDAARAYDAAAFELYGEFAWLNFPEEHITSYPDIPF